MRKSQLNARTLGNSFVGQVVAVVVRNEKTRTITTRILMALLPIAERLGLSRSAMYAGLMAPVYAAGDCMGRARSSASCTGASWQGPWQRHDHALCRLPVA